MMGDEVHRVKKVRKKKNSILTNSTKCAIIKAQDEGTKEAGALRGRWVQLPPSPPKIKKIVLDKSPSL